MAEYIHRDLTIQFLCEACSNFEENVCTLPDECEDIRIIRAMSAENVQSVDRWISVEDRLPDEIGYYLVVIGNEMLVSIDIAEYSENRWHKHDEVLYWQPLPDYPEAIKG